jgi:hypothetical protein
MNYVELWQNCAKLVDENNILKKMIGCYEKINNHTMVSCCQNIFCGDCLMKWLQTNNNSCPLCRHVLTPLELSFIGDEDKDEKKVENVKKPKTKKETVMGIIKNCKSRKN